MRVSYPNTRRKRALPGKLSFADFGTRTNGSFVIIYYLDRAMKPLRARRHAGTGKMNIN